MLIPKVVVAFLFVAMPTCVLAGAPLSDYQKETVAAFREMTLHLLYFGGGILALVATEHVWRTAAPTGFRVVLTLSALCLAFSLLAGLFVLMGLVDQLRVEKLDLTKWPVLVPSSIQFYAGVVGVLLFGVCLLRRIWE